MKKNQLDDLFKQATWSLDDFNRGCWLARVYGQMQDRMTEEDYQLMKSWLAEQSKKQGVK